MSSGESLNDSKHTRTSSQRHKSFIYLQFYCRIEQFTNLINFPQRHMFICSDIAQSSQRSVNCSLRTTGPWTPGCCDLCRCLSTCIKKEFPLHLWTPPWTHTCWLLGGKRTFRPRPNKVRPEETKDHLHTFLRSAWHYERERAMQVHIADKGWLEDLMQRLLPLHPQKR